MRFILDVVVSDPGAELGESPTRRFEPQPRYIDTDVALAVLGAEIELLVTCLGELDNELWFVTIDRDEVDAHWIVRHTPHDVTHHLGDVATLRTLLSDTGRMGRRASGFGR